MSYSERFFCASENDIVRLTTMFSWDVVNSSLAMIVIEKSQLERIDIGPVVSRVLNAGKIATSADPPISELSVLLSVVDLGE